MKINVLAFDKASQRTYDVDGRLHVSKTHFSKANVCPYYGQEIPGFEELGLIADKVYKLWRDPAELEKAATTFNNLPLLRRHVAVSADAPMKEDVVGSIGSDVTFNAPYLDASLSVWDSQAIAAIEEGVLDELSAGYRYTADMTAGTTPDGEAYDGVMRNIIGNHLALVEVGRAGSDVVVADSNPFINKETTAMKKTKLGTALMVALSAASPKLAQDSQLSKLVGGAVKSKLDKAALKTALLGMDADFNPQQLDNIVDAILDVEQNPEPMQPNPMGASDDTPTDPYNMDENDNGAPSKHAEIIDYLKKCGLNPEQLEGVGNMLTRMSEPPKAQDAVTVEPAGEGNPEKMQHAMDAMRKEMQEQFRQLDIAKSDVRSVVGDVIGMDSADQVYRFALDQMKVDHSGISGKGLQTLLKVAKDRSAPQVKNTIAQDAASIKAISGLERFGKA